MINDWISVCFDGEAFFARNKDVMGTSVLPSLSLSVNGVWQNLPLKLICTHNVCQSEFPLKFLDLNEFEIHEIFSALKQETLSAIR
jgi:hypothetical protein